MPTTRGVIWIHSAPAALCPHVEWAISRVLENPVRLEWEAQPVELGTRRAEWSWFGPAGTGAELVSAIRNCRKLRFEVTEDPADGVEGTRWSYTPDLGLHSAVIGVHGDLMVSESRLRQAMAAGIDLRAGLDELLGTAWDDELERFRMAVEEEHHVPWLHAVG
jgi:hypothetical protein